MLPFNLTNELKSAFDGDWIELSNILSDYGIEEKYINFELSSGVIYSAMEDPVVEIFPKYYHVPIPAIGQFELGGMIQSTGGFSSQGLVVFLKKEPYDSESLSWCSDGTKNNYAIVGASHTAPRTITIIENTGLFSSNEVRAHEVSGLSGKIKVRNQNYHVYNDLDVFLIDNRTLPSDFLPTNKFDETFFHLDGREERLNGCITQVWSGNFDVKNDVLKMGDRVYFLGRHNKSFGEVKRFRINDEKFPKHIIIECKLKIKEGDSGGILFKHDPAKEEFIAVGICSYYMGYWKEDWGVESFFVPLTDLDKSIYELPPRPPPIEVSL